MKPRKLMIVGAGNWGKMWIEKVHAHPQLELRALVGRTQATLQHAVNKYRLDSSIVFTDLQAALGAVEVDIVVVVTPAACHFEHVRSAMQAGRHVICEKPLADSFAAATRISEVTKQYPEQNFMVAQTRRFTSQIASIHRAIASDKIGTIDTINFDHRVYCTVGGYRQAMAMPVLEDMIIHHLDAIRYLTSSNVVSVYAEGWKPRWSQLEGQGSNNVLATMTNGIHINYFGTWTAKGYLNSYDGVMKIMGDKGSLDLVDDSNLWFYPVHGEDTGPNPPPESIPIVELEHREIDGVIHAFLQALDTNSLPPCNIDDNLQTFAFNCAVLESCRTARTVNITEFLS